jgi:hypothetical protein
MLGLLMPEDVRRSFMKTFPPGETVRLSESVGLGALTSPVEVSERDLKRRMGAAVGVSPAAGVEPSARSGREPTAGSG